MLFRRGNHAKHLHFFASMQTTQGHNTERHIHKASIMFPIYNRCRNVTLWYNFEFGSNICKAFRKQGPASEMSKATEKAATAVKVVMYVKKALGDEAIYSANQMLSEVQWKVE